MGTNYYLHKNVCEHCSRSDEPLHIGKSSGGWCFGLHVLPDEGINDLPDWEREWSKPRSVIRDEYGRDVTPEDMKLVIQARTWPHKVEMGYSSAEEFHRENHSEPGPFGLARHRIGQHCVGHGMGTWDLIEGEFS